MTDVEQIRYITRNYYTLQGLRSLPIAVYIIFIAMLQIATPQLHGNIQAIILIGGLFMMLALYQWIGVYYVQHFGAVTIHTRPYQQLWCTLAIFAPLLIAVILDARITAPIFFEASAWMLIFLGYWWVQRRFRRHYLVAAIIFGIASIVPAFTFVYPHYQPGAYLPIFHLLFGGTWLVICLIDHRLLQRAMVLTDGTVHV